jgi:hypothetical protein
VQTRQGDRNVPNRLSNPDATRGRGLAGAADRWLCLGRVERLAARAARVLEVLASCIRRKIGFWGLSQPHSTHGELRHSHCAFPFRNADSTLTSFRHALEDIYGECAALQICDFIVQATGNDACERSFLFGHNDFKTESEFLEAVGLALQRLPEDFAGRPQIVISSGFRHVLGAASIRYLGSKESNNGKFDEKAARKRLARLNTSIIRRIDEHEPPPQPIAPPDTPIDPGGGRGPEFGSLQALTIDVLKGVAKTCQSGIRVSKRKSAVAVT